MRTFNYLDQPTGRPVLRLVRNDAGQQPATAAVAPRRVRVDNTRILEAAGAARAALLGRWLGLAWSVGARAAADIAGGARQWTAPWRRRLQGMRFANELRELDGRLLRDIGIDNLDDFLRSARQR